MEHSSGQKSLQAAFRRAAPWCLAMGMGMGMGSMAQAASVTGVNAVAAAGAPVSAVFNFDFDAPINLSDFNLNLTFDGTKLTLVNPFDFIVVNSGLNQSDLDVVAKFPVGDPVTGATAAFIGPPNLSVAATAQIQVNFTSTLLAGESSVVGLTFDYLDAANPDIRQTLTPTSVTFSVPAVPEPMSWALMLAGVGVVGALGRRKTPVAH